MTANAHKYAGMSAFSYILNRLIDEGPLTGIELAEGLPPHLKHLGSRAKDLWEHGVLSRVEERPPGKRRATYRYTLVDLDKMPANWRDEHTPHKPHKRPGCPGPDDIERIAPVSDTPLPDQPPKIEPPRPTEPGVKIVVETSQRRYALSIAEARAIYNQLAELFDPQT